MKSVLELFNVFSEAVGDEFGEADAGERLRVAVSLVELSMRHENESFYRKCQESMPMLPRDEMKAPV